MATNRSIGLCMLFAIIQVIFSQCRKEEEPLTMKDTDGNLYQTVKINNQVWMSENLRTTKLNDGTQLINLENPNTWVASSESGYCWYNNDEAANKIMYGALYNFEAIQSGRLCPVGWHIPNDSEFSSMIDFLGGDSLSTRKLKVTGTSAWSNNATNESGFSAQPGGYRWAGSFNSLSYLGYWWSYSSTENLNHYLQMSYKSEVLSFNYGFGFSVRCIKND